MERKQPGSPAMRVSIVSASRNQREYLKRLIEQHGPHVVGMSGFRDYDINRYEQRPDVLLVDLGQADDISLTRIETLLEQSNIPILFNESAFVPITAGAYRDDWIDHLVEKLYTLATHRTLLAKPTLSDRPRYAQTEGHTLPNVLIIAHSKTRRRVLQIILAAQGIRDSTEISFKADFIAQHIEHYDAVLVDEHNISPEEQAIFDKLTAQTRVPIQICNSSTIPYSALARRTWGIQLAGKIIKISKLKPELPPETITIQTSSDTPTYTPSNDLIAINGEHEWGNRLSEVLAQVRSNLMQAAMRKVHQSASQKASEIAAASVKNTTAPTLNIAKASQPVSSVKQPSLAADATAMAKIDTHSPASKTKEKPTVSGAKSPQREIKEKKTANTSRLSPTQPAAQASIQLAKPQIRNTNVKHTPVRVNNKKLPHDIIDATNLDAHLPPNKVKSSRPLSTDARDSEIERFFDFDKELDISQQRHALGDGHILSSAANNEILPWNLEEELTNPFSNTSRQTGKKQRSLWRDSLNGIRKKLPRLFH